MVAASTAVRTFFGNGVICTPWLAEVETVEVGSVTNLVEEVRKSLFQWEVSMTESVDSNENEK